MSEGSEENLIENESITDNNFQRVLDQFRKNEEFTDVTLKVGDKLFPAHRNVLSIRSPVLMALISEQWSTEAICEIGNEYVDAEIMEDLLSFLYTGRMKITYDNVHPACVAAHFLQIPSLLEIGVEHLCKLVSVENLFPFYEFSMNCQLEKLRNSCLRFITLNHEKVFQDSRILECTSSIFQDMINGLKGRPGYLQLRENTFHCIIRWTESDTQNRSIHLSKLLANIPLEELTKEFLSQTVLTHLIVNENAPDVIERWTTDSNTNETKQNLIVVGGVINQKECQSPMCYNSETKVWKQLPKMIHPNRYLNWASVTAVNESKIVVWGEYCVNETPYESADTLEMFDCTKNTWAKLPEMPVRLAHPSIAGHDNLLYLIGRPRKIDLYSNRREFLCYSFETRKWKFLKSMENAGNIEKDLLIGCKNFLYAFSGAECPLQKYDPIKNEWTVLSKSEKDSYHGFNTFTTATVHQNKIFLCGRGYFAWYDPETNVFTSLPKSSSRYFSHDITLVSMNEKLLAVSVKQPSNFAVKDKCEDENSISKSIYEFDFSEEKWILFCKMDSKSVSHLSVVGKFN